MKRILAFLLCFCLCVSLVPATYAEDADEIIILDEEPCPEDGDEGLIDIVEPIAAPPADEPRSGNLIATGSCGRSEDDDLVWKLYDDGELRIVGSGEMADYHFFDPAPWKEYDDPDVGVPITKLSFGEGITYIGHEAFTDMGSLASAELPASLLRIMTGAFSGCDSLAAFTVARGSETFSTIDGVLFSLNQMTLMIFPGGKLSLWDWTYTVPDGTAAIADAAFYGNKYLSYIELPGGLERIGESAFQGCEKLRELYLPSSVKELSRRVCKDCSMLWDVSLWGVTTIGYGAFENCLGLHEVYIPNTVNSIECCAFKGSGLTIIDVPNSVQTLESQAFMECPWLETVVIGTGVSDLGSDTFYDCPMLDRVIFRGSAPSIAVHGSGHTGAFNHASFTALYPAEDTSWSSVINKDYGGDVTWEPYTDGLFIKKQPVSQLVYEDWTAEFSFQIGCVSPAVYRWQYKTPDALNGPWKDTPPEWGDQNFITIPDVPLAWNGAMFRCQVTSGNTTLTTDEVELVVKSFDKPYILSQPEDVADYVGNTAVYEVEAGGKDLIYEWQYTPGTGPWSKSSAAGANTPRFEVPILGYRDGYYYRCRVYNASGYVYTNPARLTALGKVEITSQPQNISVKQDATAKFTVGASGVDLSYQWQVSSKSNDYTWTDSTLSTAKSATLSVKGTAARDGNYYRCKVSNVGGAVYSDSAKLTVLTKPTITGQPKSVTVAVGDTAKFTVTAGGSGLSYQWQYRTSSSGSWSNSGGTGAKTKTLSVIGQSYRSGYQYRCIVTNEGGSTTSSAATLTVVKALKPAITTQPKSVTKTAGSTATFTVAATGGSLSYQWQFLSPTASAWSNCSDASATSATLSVEAKSYRDGYQYRCIVKNSKGSATSSSATLTVVAVDKPTITTQPKSVTVAEGKTATFKVVASNAVSYQWYFRSSASAAWTKCTGGTSASLSVEGKAYRNGYQYRCAVKNKGGTTYSSAATLTVTTIAKPTITKQPVNAAVTIGQTANFTVTATGSGTLSYQWYFRSSPSEAWSKCTGGTGANLSVEGKAYRNGYEYRCGVTNSAGTTYSSAATLTVLGG